MSNSADWKREIARQARAAEKAVLGVDIAGHLPLIANQKKFESLVGRKLPAEIFSFAPWGHRLVVLRETPHETMGSLYIPKIAQEQLAEGWVLSVGGWVGKDHASFLGVCPYPRERLIGCKVIFGKYQGDNINVDTNDPDKQKQVEGFVILLDNDIWGTVGEPPQELVL
jgi:co-chaperonin GroES (HSP10)